LAGQSFDKPLGRKENASMAERAHLVVQHVEMIPRELLDAHPEIVREYVRGRQGVYALYRGKRLYYVGLASNLRSRLKAHLKDRHAEAWDGFSMYLTEVDVHLRELEALVLRITMPSGNRARTKFARSKDLRQYFRRRIVEGHREDLQALLGTGVKGREARTLKDGEKAPSLAGYLVRRTPLRMTYKGKIYRATAQPDGRLRYKGKYYNSPSTPASQVTKRPMNGWHEWTYEVSPGDWVRLKTLRTTRRR
jgi:predicted GIY-YIG superfamily endonuclease